MQKYASYTDTVVFQIKEVPDQLKGPNGEFAVKQIADPNNLASIDFIHSMSMDLFEEIYSELQSFGANRIAFDRDSETGEYIFVGLKCEPDLSDEEAKQQKINEFEYAIKIAKRESREHEDWMNTFRMR